MKENCIRLDLGFATLVAEKCDMKDFREIYVYIMNEKNGASQGLAIIRQDSGFDAVGSVAQPKQLEVLVYGDCQSDDFTNRIPIDICEEIGE